MRRILIWTAFMLAWLFRISFAFAATGDATEESNRLSENESRLAAQSILKSEIVIGVGWVILADGKVRVNTPPGYELLSKSGSNFVLEQLWGNLHDDRVLGLLVPVGFPEKGKSWWVVMSYIDSGHISDSDAHELVDSDKLLEKLQSGQNEAAKTMEEQGLTPFDITGWLAQPVYDSVDKKLAWGLKMTARDEEKSSSLNYEIRILGRAGYLQLEGLGSEDELPMIKLESEKIMKGVGFVPGHSYADFNPSTDKAAEYGLLGLIGGVAVAKKLGIFAIFLKFWKVMIVGVIAFYSKIKNKILGWLGKKPEEVTEDKKEEESTENV